MRTSRALWWLVLLLFLVATACQNGDNGENEGTAVAEATATADPDDEDADSDAPAGSRTPRPSRTPTADDADPEATPTIRSTGAAQVLDERGRPLIEVNAASINVRRGPGIDAEAFRFLYEGDTVVIIATSDDGGWFQIEMDDGVTGWVSSAVVIPLTDRPYFPTETPNITPTFQPGQIGARVIFSSIHLRTGPGVEYEVLRYLFVDEGLIVNGRNEEGDWYFVETRAGRSGWVGAHVVEFVTGDDEGDLEIVTDVPTLP